MYTHTHTKGQLLMSIEFAGMHAGMCREMSGNNRGGHTPSISYTPGSIFAVMATHTRTCTHATCGCIHVSLLIETAVITLWKGT